MRNSHFSLGIPPIFFSKILGKSLRKLKNLGRTPDLSCSVNADLLSEKGIAFFKGSFGPFGSLSCFFFVVIL